MKPTPICTPENFPVAQITAQGKLFPNIQASGQNQQQNPTGAPYIFQQGYEAPAPCLQDMINSQEPKNKYSGLSETEGKTEGNAKASILVFGETGNGKSTLGNWLLNCKAFSTSGSVNAETKDTIGKFGEGDAKDVFVIDTPGLQDTEGADKEHLMQMIDYIKKHEFLQSIAIVFNYQQPRFPYNIQTMLKLFCNIFPMEQFINHIAIVFTKAYSRKGSVPQEMKAKRVSEVLPVFKKVIMEASGFNMTNNPPVIFVDLDPDEGPDSDSKLELNRLVAWASNLDPISTLKVKDNVSTEFKTEEDETRTRTEEKKDGEYIITAKISETRKKRIGYNDQVSYTDWVITDRTETKVLDPEIVRMREEARLKQEEHERQMREMERQRDEERRRRQQEEERRRRQEEEYRRREEERRRQEEQRRRQEEERRRQEEWRRQEEDRRRQEEWRRRQEEERRRQEEQNNINNLVERTLRGEFGNGNERMRRLGNMFAPVQNEINRRFGCSKRY